MLFLVVHTNKERFSVALHRLSLIDHNLVKSGSKCAQLLGPQQVNVGTLDLVLCVHICYPLRTLTSAKCIEALRGKVVVKVSVGSAHSACILETGELYTWGLGDYGRLGHGSKDNFSTPKQVRTKVLCVTSSVYSAQIPSVVVVLVVFPKRKTIPCVIRVILFDEIALKKF